MELFESELFGYEKGTFTDAQTRKLGKLELVQGGTVYFDDIASLAPGLQAKLLRAIQEKRFTRLGGNQTVALDGRVISSSSIPAEELLSGLRRDLFYRINVVTLTIPPLRERREDIPQLARSFLARRKRAIDAAAMRMLVEHDWPGNVRELRNVIERAVLIEESDVITPASLPPLDRRPRRSGHPSAVDARRSRVALHPRSPAPDEVELLARRGNPRDQSEDAAGEAKKVWD